MRPLLVRPHVALLSLITAFVAGFFTGSPHSVRGGPPSVVEKSQFEERGPPSRQELGQAGWTLLHVMAANTPDNPTAEQALRVENFLTALGHLYPCPTCAAHFRSHIQHHPIVSSSREALSLWLCEAHNEVNLRNGKRPFYCDLGVLDARWKDCGCGNKTAAAAVVDALPLAPPTALPAANAAGVTWERRPTKRHGLRRLRAPLNAAAPLDV